MSLGAKIKYKRNGLGLTQKELAKKVGVASTTICQLEKNGQIYTIDLIKNVAEALELEATEEELKEWASPHFRNITEENRLINGKCIQHKREKLGLERSQLAELMQDKYPDMTYRKVLDLEKGLRKNGVDYDDVIEFMESGLWEATIKEEKQWTT